MTTPVIKLSVYYENINEEFVYRIEAEKDASPEELMDMLSTLGRGNGKFRVVTTTGAAYINITKVLTMFAVMEK